MEINNVSYVRSYPHQQQILLALARLVIEASRPECQHLGVQQSQIDAAFQLYALVFGREFVMDLNDRHARETITFLKCRDLRLSASILSLLTGNERLKTFEEITVNPSGVETEAYLTLGERYPVAQTTA